MKNMSQLRLVASSGGAFVDVSYERNYKEDN